MLIRYFQEFLICRRNIINHEKHEKREKIIFKDKSYALQYEIFEVHKKTDSGFFNKII